MTTRISIVLFLLAAAGCLDNQHNGVDVGNLQCVSCHLPDFQRANAADPTHTNQDCAQCHDTSSWDAGHPEAAFPIQSGAHQGIACKTCHSEAGPYVKGANTNCIQCHPSTQTDPEHTGVGGYAYSTSTPNFCLTCHPNGKADGHNEVPFPIKTGNHVGIACNSCHQSSLGSNYKTNFDCYANGACHSVNHNGTSSSPGACFSCHPSGTADSGN